MHMSKALMGVTVAAVVLLAGAWTGSVAPRVQRGSSAQASTQTATEFYMAYEKALAKATKVEDLYPYMSAKNIAQAKSAPASDRTQMFGMLKMMAPTNVKVLKEDRQADGSVILTCQALGMASQKTTGKVTIVKEGGAWKLGEENYSS